MESQKLSRARKTSLLRPRDYSAISQLSRSHPRQQTEACLANQSQMRRRLKRSPCSEGSTRSSHHRQNPRLPTCSEAVRLSGSQRLAENLAVKRSQHRHQLLLDCFHSSRRKLKARNSSRLPKTRSSEASHFLLPRSPKKRSRPFSARRKPELLCLELHRPSHLDRSSQRLLEACLVPTPRRVSSNLQLCFQSLQKNQKPMRAALTMPKNSKAKRVLRLTQTRTKWSSSRPLDRLFRRTPTRERSTRRWASLRF